jgi:hypothetical protein
MNNRIIIKTESNEGVHSVTGYVDNKEVINISNRVENQWGIGSSSTLPYDWSLALLYNECVSAVMAHVKTLQSYHRGVRVKLKTMGRNGFGTIEFVEPNGERIWVLRDGASSPVFFHPYELDIV